jgi:phospholipase C
MRLRRSIARCALFAGFALALAATAACSGGSSTTPQVSTVPDSAAPQRQTGATTFEQPSVRSSITRFGKKANPIQHVVIIMQENNSFDHLFNGYPGADTAQSGKIHTGKTVQLTMQHLGDATNTNHWAATFLSDYDGGKMDGFDLNGNAQPNLLAYTFIDPADIQPYYQMAQQYVLADNFFTSHIDASFVAHQYIIAAQANHAVNLPTGSWGCEPNGPDYVTTLNPDRTIGQYESPCFTYKTLADELDAAGLTWHFYAPYITCPPSDPSCNTNGGIWSAYQAVSQIYNGSDWASDVISPETNVLTDIQNGTLENVTWVVPSEVNSDHPGSNSKTGPAWVASIVNAVGESPFWDSTAIFITWDEWGGQFDHVKPPYKDYDGDGFRVPLLCISPYAYQGQVNKTPGLEVAGIVRYVENTFGLKTLAAADKRAQPADTGCTNPSQSTPRSFTPIASQFGRNYFLHRQKRDDTVPPDDY